MTVNQLTNWLKTFPEDKEVIVRQGFTTDIYLFVGNWNLKQDLDNNRNWLRIGDI